MMEGRRGLVLAVLAAFLLTQALCQLTTPINPQVSCPAGHASSWLYNNSGNWGSLCSFYSLCCVGQKQSPVDIPTLPNNGQTLQLDLNFIPINFIRTSQLLTMPAPQYTGELTWRNQIYTMNDIEFHAPSEHSIGGVQAALEVQLYFSRSDRRGVFQAAVSFLFNPARFVCDDPFLAAILPAVPSMYKCQCGNNRTESYPPFNEQCDEGSANANAPNTCRLNCQLPKCGDGILDRGEQCDLGPNSTTLCRSNCKLPYCGDGILDAGEICDPGAALFEGSGCTANCTKECGNGCLEPGEDCDYGIPTTTPNQMTNVPNATYRVTCRANCFWARCGDGILDYPEQCDQGNYSLPNNTGGSWAPNTCRPNCTTPLCGDGVVDSLWSNVNATGTPRGGEQCEVALSGPIACLSNCSWACGDGLVSAANNETCDNNGQNSLLPWTNSSLPAPCRPWSSVTPCKPANCGDGIVDPANGEDCDTFGIQTPLCFANCTFRCGNRYIDSGETCDNGNPLKFPKRANDGNSNTRPNACRNDCHLAFCGDGVIDPVFCEQCDNGDPTNPRFSASYAATFNTTNYNSNLPNACRQNCKLPICGDGIVDSGEICDDGNNVDDDGCSCCVPDCGNGIKQGKEDCDDGAANSATLPDRCRPGKCVRHYCGDGVQDSNEQCDYASKTAVPGCTKQCTLPYCGDGVVNSALGEECDNGANNSYSALNGCSPICTLNVCGQTLTNNRVNLQLLASRSNPVTGAYYYAGSESKPPCAQNVAWFVNPTIRTMSYGQLDLFYNYFTNNFRPRQSLNGRVVVESPNHGIPKHPVDPRANPVCGDGIVELGEQCDNGPYNSNVEPNACRTNCQANYCGDNVVDDGEQCDGQDFCTSVCKINRISQTPPPALDACWNLANEGIWDSCGAGNQCSGNAQSPIRLPVPCADARPLQLNHPANVQYNPTPIILFNTGSEMILSVTSGGTFNWMGVTYALTSIEFHQPSEHYIGNQQFAFEVQLFHTATVLGVPRTAVLSILYAEGTTPNAPLQPIFDRLPRSACVCGNGVVEDIVVAPDARITPEQCDNGPLNNDHMPNECRTNCLLPYCGDNVVDSGEYCDQGILNANSPNACRLNCQLPRCGDGIVDTNFGEHCDDGNVVSGDGCDAYCQLECGNGVLDAGEQCDLGSGNSDTSCNTCRTNCKLPYCGDNVVDSGEVCDQGPLNAANKPNTCRLGCTLPYCGDGVTDPAYGEQCDGGSGCLNCQLLCGNGVVDAGEQCDNGALNNNVFPGSCRTSCTRMTCGDFTVDPGEQCDAGTSGSQLCSPQCQLLCGNGVLDYGEQCDNGPLNSNTQPNACRNNCMLPSCGDNVIDVYEECDNGIKNSNTPNQCRTCCQVPLCGDSIVDADETCDDGNLLDGDGCSATCQLECGNGVINAGEQCDDGTLNSRLSGACRPNCKLPICGDGVTDPGEQCDNGAGNAFGPNDCRPTCTLPFCGDGIPDWAFGEVCDYGMRNSLTAIDGCSPSCTPNLCRQSVNYNATLNPQSLLPTTAGTLTYQGSDSSPPCSENAAWFVFTTPQPISTCQLNQFRQVLSNNNRCLQARNGRVVTYLEVNAVCGDGIVEGNEQCDNGPENSDYAPNACRRNCLLPHCGDGVRDAGEVCDGTPNCGHNCQLACSA